MLFDYLRRDQKITRVLSTLQYPFGPNQIVTKNDQNHFRNLEKSGMDRNTGAILNNVY
jgi:hypothetical protein